MALNTRFVKAVTLSAFLGLSALPGGAMAASELTLVSSGQVVSVLDRDMIGALPQAQIVTENEHVEGEATFSGPLARDVLASAGLLNASEVMLVAANDYAITVPVEDFVEYDVIFATEVNGRRLSLRDKGPIWVVYPMSDHPELQNPIYNSRLIWQLVKVEHK